MHTRRIYLTPWCIQILYSDAWLRQHGNYDHLVCTISNNPGSKECGLAQIGNLLYEHWTAVSFWSRNQPNEDPNRAYEEFYSRFTPLLVSKATTLQTKLGGSKKRWLPNKSWEKKLDRKSHVWTPVTRPDLVCRLLLEKKKKKQQR